MVAVGDTFSSAYGAGTPRWRVTEQAGADIWLAELVDEERLVDGSVYFGAYAGIRKAFTTAEIEAALDHASAVAAAKEAHAAWWASQNEGDVVHYDLGTGEFIRGVVVAEGGEMRMRAIALVGDWSSFDLPGRDSDGSIYVPPSAEAVVRGTTMQPSPEAMYESSTYAGQASDPRSLEPIDLRVPEPGEWLAAEYDRVRLADQVIQVLSDHGVPTKVRLSRARELLVESGRASRVPNEDMDPDETLAEMHQLAAAFRDYHDPLAVRFVQLFLLLDRWLADGGFLPRRWEG